MSATSSDTESISEWTLLDHDGDIESTDESSSSGSSVEVLSIEAGAAMFILRVNSTEISESDESDGDHSNKRKNLTMMNSLSNVKPAPSLHDARDIIDSASTGSEVVQDGSNLVVDTDHSHDTIQDMAVTDHLVQSFPVLVEAGSVELNDQSVKMDEDVSMDDIEIISVKSDSISGDREISDSAVDDIDILPLNERPDLEEEMERSHVSEFPLIGHVTEDNGTRPENKPEACLEVDGSKKSPKRGMIQWILLALLEVSSLLFVAAAVLVATLIYMNRSDHVCADLGTESKLLSCKLDVKICTQEHIFFKKKFKQMFRKKIENEEYKNEINQLRLEVADLRSSVSRLRYAVMPPIAQREMESTKSMLELRVKVAHLESEKDRLHNELVSVKEHALPPSTLQTGRATQTPVGYQEVEKLELEKMHPELSSFKPHGLDTLVNEMDKEDGAETEDRKSHMLLQLKTLQKDLAMERAWSRHIYKLYTEKSADYLKLSAQAHFMQFNATQVFGDKWYGPKIPRKVHLATSNLIKENDHWTDDGSNEDQKTATEETEQSRDINTEKKWSDSIMEVLNRTQSSVLDVNRQIQDTWKQVKNLSEEMWAKNKPKLDKLQQRFTDKLLKVSQRFQNKINRKVKKWFKKTRKHRRPESNWESQKQDVPNEYSTEDTKCEGYFKQVVRYVTSINKEHFQDMTNDDTVTFLENFEEFRTTIGTQMLLEKSNSWFQCQYRWWTEIVSGPPRVDLTCVDMLKCWQLKQAETWRQISCRTWKKVRWNFLRKPCKNPANHKSDEMDIQSQMPVVEDDLSNEASQKANSYEHAIEADNSTEELVLDICNPVIDADCYETKLTWYMKMVEGRQYLRNVEEDSSFEGDHKSDWLFDRASEREFKRTHPDDWFFRRMKKFEEFDPHHRDD